MAADHGPEEAARRYRATVVTTLRQLRGLAEMRLRLVISPADGHEAVRFWLLPRLADAWRCEHSVFYSTGWQIDFGGETHGFAAIAHGEILCPNLGARWVHTAMLGLGISTHCVSGPAESGGEYFRAYSATAPMGNETKVLPALPIIRSSRHWDDALASPLGPALKRAWEEEKDR